MARVKDVLRELDFGSSVAEFDQQLETYFVETQPFYDLLNNRRDIIAGDKGTGKTAIFKVLHKRYANMPEIKNTIVLPAFNLNGNPIFLELAQKGTLDEGEYSRVWKAYILALVGNWILRSNKNKSNSSLAQLDMLLRGLELRSDAEGPKPIFERIIARIGSLFKGKSLEFGIDINNEGLSFKPKVELDSSSEDQLEVSIEKALALLNVCLKSISKTVWVALERLDEAFQGYPDVEIPALRALLRTYLDPLIPLTHPAS